MSLEVIDVDTRVKSAERTIDRLRGLLGESDDLGDVIRVESELARREADLEALKAQQTYLTDQTSLSTITLTLQPPRASAAPEENTTGFVAGLGAGWDSLVRMLSFGATAAGALLPFLVLFAAQLRR